MNGINLKSERFCHEILNLKIRRCSATANLIMAIASYEGARSPTELSESPVFHHQYGSITKAVSDLARGPTERAEVQKEAQSLYMRYFSEPGAALGRKVFQTDTSPVEKAHSPTLPDRTYIAVPNNVIPGNKPLSIGYEVSFVNLSEGATKWSLPLSAGRVGVHQTASEKALEQWGQLLSHPELGLSECLCLNTLDSKYGNAAYLAPAFKHQGLVNLARFKAGMKVWKAAPRRDTGGAPKVYGEKFYLLLESRAREYKKHPKTGLPYEVSQRSVFELPADEHLEFGAQTAQGRKLQIQLWRWDEMMIRSKNGNIMKDKPFSLLGARVQDAKTGKAVFKRGLFVAIAGQRKGEVSTLEGYQAYRQRYDIEPMLRFSKRSLLLDKFQTPVLEHFDNWLLVNQMAAWLLYTASTEASFRPKKWRQYLPKNKQAQQQPRLSIAQTRQAAQALFLTFDPVPFWPLESKKGKPRQKGETQSQRTRHEVVKKASKRPSKKPKTKLKTEKIE